MPSFLCIHSAQSCHVVLFHFVACGQSGDITPGSWGSPRLSARGTLEMARRHRGTMKGVPQIDPVASQYAPPSCLQTLNAINADNNTHPHTLLFQLHTLQGCCTAQHMNIWTIGNLHPLRYIAKSHCMVQHARHGPTWKPWATGKTENPPPKSERKGPSCHLGKKKVL